MTRRKFMDRSARTAAALVASPALADSAANAARQAPLKVLMLSASNEYHSDESLAEFKRHLEAKHGALCTLVTGVEKGDSLPGIEAIDGTQVLVVFTRRVSLAGEALERVKRYCQSGKPVVGIRTASHAFQTWLEFDREVLGGDYQNHFGAGPICEVKLVANARNHPVLNGVRAFKSPGSLYKNPGVAADVQLLLTGTIPDHTEPVAWTRTHKGGRVFYTSLGHPNDFKEPNFRQLLTNGVLWAGGRLAPAG